MKHIVVAALAMTALSSATVFAADLPQRPVYKAAPVMMVPATWTGWFLHRRQRRRRVVAYRR